MILDSSAVLDSATRHLFLTGKGGVGKTSHACALAVALADRGRSVLLVSTDPASNLSEVLGVPVGFDPVSVPGTDGLRAMNVDPAAATRSYRETALEPYREVAPATELQRMEEQLSGACTTEIATFDHFTRLLSGDDERALVDHVIFDTAPTGHTLRLLQLPAAWTGYMEYATPGQSCLGPAAGHAAQRRRFQVALEALRDPEVTTLYLVARPDEGSLAEAERTSRELAGLGITHQRLLLNGVFQAIDRSDPLALSLEEQGQRALEQFLSEGVVGERLSQLPRLEVPLRGRNLVGLDLLRDLMRSAPEPDQAQGREASGEEAQRGEAKAASGTRNGRPAPAPDRAEPASDLATSLPAPTLPPFRRLLDELAGQDAGLVLVMGKGGVGKTSLAAGLAVGLADRGHPVHLATTDPAAHLGQVLPRAAPGIRVSHIDAEAETARYRERVLRTRGKGMEPEEYALLQEDLASPCTHEVAVFQAFSRLVNEGRRGWVILDTAPTGHTLLLLDTAGAYHREILRNQGGDSPGVGSLTTPLMRLQDPAYARVLVATLPETTPVEEARALQDDLRRAGIEPWAWVLNQSLAAAHPTDPLLVERAGEELSRIRRVRDDLASRLAVIPHLAEPPVGVDGLRRMFQ